MAVTIRSILIRRLLLATLVLVGGGCWLMYLQVEHETEELFDAQLARSARLILSLVQADRNRITYSSIQKFLDQNRLTTESDPGFDNALENLFREEAEELPDGHIYETKLGFQIWDNLGNLLLKSNNLPVTEIASNSGFGNIAIGGSQWRVFSLTAGDGAFRCVTAERIDVRNDLIDEIFEDLLLFFVVLVPVLLITLWFSINSALVPLQSLTSQIQARGAERLDSITTSAAPAEIQTITEALNRLLTRLSSALARERRVISDAAHELRTPLAAVRLHAELASKADNADDRKLSIERVLDGIDRSTHLVKQLLTLARLSRDSFQGEMLPHSIAELIVEEIALQVALAEEKQIEIEINELDRIVARVDETAFRLLVGNLVSNAITYTPRGGRIHVDLQNRQDRFLLVVEDNGPGIPEEERERVFNRFYRLHDHGQSGCGIGLSIVMQVVEMHNASLSLDTPDQGSGLRVSVSFPLQPR